MDGENGGEGRLTRRDVLKFTALAGIAGVATQVAAPEYIPTSEDQDARDILNDEKEWQERDGIFVSGEGEVENIDGRKADYRVDTQIVNTFLIDLARRDGVEDEFTEYLAQNPLHIRLDRPEFANENRDWEMEKGSKLAQFIAAEGKSLMVIYKLFFDVYNLTDRKSDLSDMVFVHELHHLFQFIKNEAVKMRRKAVLLDGAARGVGFAVGHEVIGGLGASKPVTTRRAFLKWTTGFIGLKVMGSISTRFLGGTNAPIERDAYSETDKLTQSDFFEPYKGKFLKVTEV